MIRAGGLRHDRLPWHQTPKTGTDSLPRLCGATPRATPCHFYYLQRNWGGTSRPWRSHYVTGKILPLRLPPAPTPGVAGEQPDGGLAVAAERAGPAIAIAGVRQTRIPPNPGTRLHRRGRFVQEAARRQARGKSSGAERQNRPLTRMSHGFRLSLAHQSLASLSPRLVEITLLLGATLGGPRLGVLGDPHAMARYRLEHRHDQPLSPLGG